MNKYVIPLVIFLAFEAVAMGLWLALDNLFCLLDFSYIGSALALGIALYIRKSNLRDGTRSQDVRCHAFKK